MGFFRKRDYRAYLNEKLSIRGATRGQRAALAQALGIQASFISQVILKKTHFSIEQAIRVCDYFEFSQKEKDYFLCLVQMERAGTVQLQNYFTQKLDKMDQEDQEVAATIKNATSLSETEKATYYSAWYYAAIHVAVSIPKLQTLSKLCQALDLPVPIVQKTLDFLVSINLVKKSEGRYSIGPTRIHLDSNSPLLSVHHTHWRLRAIESFKNIKIGTDHGIHYSGVVSLSRNDVEKIKEMILELIKNSEKIIGVSPEEKLQAIVFDFFEISSKTIP